MSHIHTKPGQHDLTASAYIVRLDTPEPTLLLHMHKKLNKYLQFGGHVELHETPWQAVTHEVAEESGYGMSQLQLLQPTLRLKHFSDAELHPYPVYLQTHRFTGLDHFHTDIAFAFATDQSPTGTIGADESKEIRTFTLKELQKLPANKIPANVRETGIFVLTELLTQWERIAFND